MLMFVVTTAAIGSAFWWRWPVQQTTDFIASDRLYTETFTYHRGFSGNLVKHGRHQITFRDELILEEYYQEDVLHGPYQLVGLAQGLVRGKYEAGKKHGAWEYDSGEHQFIYEFKMGTLVAAPNSPCGRLLFRRIADNELSDDKIRHALFADVDLDYPETPLREVIQDLHERFQLPLANRWRRTMVKLAPLGEPSIPPDLATVRVNVKQWPLLAGFDAMLSPLGLVLDYRYGMLCIVDAEGSEDWHDTTGVMELHPAKETLLVSRLDAPPKPTCLEPLRDVLRNLAADQGLSVKFRPDDPSVVLASIPQNEMVGLFREVVTLRNSPEDDPKEPLPITLRQLLGLILDQANLHCHEEKGVLIIEPPRKGAPVPSNR